MIVRVLGYKARFCDNNCASGFTADRQSGLCYGLHRINGVTCMHREEWSLAACRCAYCGHPVTGRVPQRLVEKFNLKEDGSCLSLCGG